MLRVGVMGFRLRAILSQVLERDFLECFFCDRYHQLMTLGEGNIDQNKKIITRVVFRTPLKLEHNWP